MSKSTSVFRLICIFLSVFRLICIFSSRQREPNRCHQTCFLGSKVKIGPIPEMLLRPGLSLDPARGAYSAAPDRLGVEGCFAVGKGRKRGRQEGERGRKGKRKRQGKGSKTYFYKFSLS